MRVSWLWLLDVVPLAVIVLPFRDRLFFREPPVLEDGLLLSESNTALGRVCEVD